MQIDDAQSQKDDLLNILLADERIKAVILDRLTRLDTDVLARSLTALGTTTTVYKTNKPVDHTV